MWESCQMNTFESKPQQSPQKPESVERIGLINDSLKQLENLADFNLITKEGRLGLKMALDRVFSNVTDIEGDDEYEVVGLIKGRIRDTYEQLYQQEYSGQAQSPEAIEFYREIEEVMEMIETRGKKFIEDMEIYQRFNNIEEAA